MKEMIYKLRYKEIRLKVADSAEPRLDGVEKVVAYCRKEYNPMNEEFRAFILNSKTRLLEAYYSEGTTNENVIYPGALMRKVLLLNGTNIILAHNHPSGECAPSQADIVMTKKIQEAGHLLGITVIDHVIYSDENYCSFVEEKLI